MLNATCCCDFLSFYIYLRIKYSEQILDIYFMSEKAYLLSEIFKSVWYVLCLKFDYKNKSEVQFHTLKHIAETGLDLSPLHICKDIFVNSCIFFTFVCGKKKSPLWRVNKNIQLITSKRLCVTRGTNRKICVCKNIREPRTYCSLTLLLVLV